MRLHYPLLIGAGSILLLACSTLMRVTPTPKQDKRPGDFDVLYEWQEGSLPPPYHYAYSIHIGSSGNAEMTMTPDYPSDQVPTWTEAFTLTQPDLDALYQALAAQGLWTQTWKGQDNPPVGGSSDSLTAQANGRTVHIPSYVIAAQEKQVQAIYAAVQALVPPASWQKLDARRTQYMQEHSKP